MSDLYRITGITTTYDRESRKYVPTGNRETMKFSSKGFALAYYEDRMSAERALRSFKGHKGMFYHDLRIEWLAGGEWVV